MIYSRVVLLFIVLLSPTVSHAATTGLPIESGIETLSNSLTGPIARGIALIAVVATGAALCWGEMRGGTKMLIGVTFGITIVLGAATVVDILAPQTSGALLP